MGEDERAGKNVFQNLPLSDNFMFTEVMRRTDICKLFLEALLGIEIEKIIVSKEETVSDTPYYHGIRLDVLAKGSTSFFDCEMFADRYHKPPLRRVRYYQGTLDRRALESGKDYALLPESFVVFICNYDYFGTGQAVCKRKMVIEGREDVIYDDGSHVYILNSEYTEGNASPAILEFLDCIRKNDVESEYQSDLMKAVCPAVIAVRNSAEKEDEYMHLQAALMDERRYGMEEGMAKGIEKGMEKGFAEAVRKFVLSLYRRGNSPEEIALDVEKPVSDVLGILKEAGCIS